MTAPHSMNTTYIILALVTGAIIYKIVSDLKAQKLARTGQSTGGGTVGSGTPVSGPVPPAGAQRPQIDQTRDTAESIAIAFVLAFLFRAFEAEAFVIPTGSMAPTLYGANKDVTCRECGCHYVVGASDDFGSTGILMPGNRVHTSICPNCQHPQKIYRDEIFKGDRILVNKFPYELGDPKRWDVIVFKYPEEAKTNYIKRLVGLPGETIQISSGDVYARKADSDPFKIPRKPLEKQLLLLQLVHDDAHVPKRLLDAGWPERWRNEKGARWVQDATARSFRIDRDPASAGDWHTIRYRHTAPKPRDWELARENKAPSEPPEPVLITDFYAYNARINADWNGEAPALHDLSDHGGLPLHGLHWVGDLSVSLNLEVIAAEGLWKVDLVEGRRRYEAEADLKTGLVTLKYFDEMWGEQAGYQPVGEAVPSPLGKPGTYSVQFLNVDDRVALLIDGKVIKSIDFEPGSKFPPQWESGVVLPSTADLAPTGISSKGASVRVDGLRLERDVYYTYASPRDDNEYLPPQQARELWRLLARPGEWAARYSQNRKTCEFRLADHEDDAEDEFFALGDNSPRSKDSRAWSHSPAVPRRLLVGKAFYIYWPHAVPFGGSEGTGFPIGFYQQSGPNGAEKSNVPWLSLPCYPQVSRMKRIR